MGRHSENPDPSHKLGGYKAAVTNQRVSNEAKQHAQEEIGRMEGGQAEQVEERHPNPENQKRGLKAAIHNERVSDEGRSSAQSKLQAMEGPGD
ncbi:uncharacterized protein N7459_000854 [Penicillium hispanicum]|uniref:uncharacterized protein n=1 Tax=Penicillium hispanicum TaxID=1080232 RepID=UPI00254130C7|nr:uncharacterized protein N7459_000854 [Penicillium hispanicum]KAJ5594646.1 hypothetical protein N7459_000854 [Penicillium hispanicum]